jgi:hypothetical protein
MFHIYNTDMSVSPKGFCCVCSRLRRTLCILLCWPSFQGRVSQLWTSSLTLRALYNHNVIRPCTTTHTGAGHAHFGTRPLTHGDYSVWADASWTTAHRMLTLHVYKGEGPWLADLAPFQM